MNSKQPTERVGRTINNALIAIATVGLIAFAGILETFL